MHSVMYKVTVIHRLFWTAINFRKIKGTKHNTHKNQKNNITEIIKYAHKNILLKKIK